MYAVPYQAYEKHGVRRYGFHGTSHKYVALQAAQLLNKPIESLKNYYLPFWQLGSVLLLCLMENPSIQVWALLPGRDFPWAQVRQHRSCHH